MKYDKDRNLLTMVLGSFAPFLRFEISFASGNDTLRRLIKLGAFAFTGNCTFLECTSIFYLERAFHFHRISSNVGFQVDFPAEVDAVFGDVHIAMKAEMEKEAEAGRNLVEVALSFAPDYYFLFFFFLVWFPDLLVC